jgi:hypothetical protein
MAPSVKPMGTQAMTMVGWDGETKHKCPCGKGAYVHRWQEYSSFPGISHEDYLMLCPDCKDKYVYDKSRVGGHPGDFVSRGWVLKAVLEEEQAYKDRIARKLEGHFREVWKARFVGCRTKKHVWQILTCDGKYYPSYSTFLKHRKESPTQVVQHIAAMPFDYHMLHQILDVCRVSKPDWDRLDVKPED